MKSQLPQIDTEISFVYFQGTVRKGPTLDPTFVEKVLVEVSSRKKLMSNLRQHSLPPGIMEADSEYSVQDHFLCVDQFDSFICSSQVIFL